MEDSCVNRPLLLFLILFSGKENFCLIHVSLVPVIGVVGEQVIISCYFLEILHFPEKSPNIWTDFGSVRANLEVHARLDVHVDMILVPMTCLIKTHITKLKYP